MSEPPARRARRSHLPVEQRREQLIRAAMQVMEQEGAWSLTTRAVAERAGVPLGAVHYAFGSKDELVAAVFANDIDSAMQLVHRAGQHPGTAQEALGQALRECAVSLRADPGIELVLQELTLMGARDAQLGTVARRSIHGYRQAVEGMLQELARARHLVWDGEVATLAELVFAQLVGLSQNWLASRDDELLDRCLEELAALVATRLRPGPQA